MCCFDYLYSKCNLIINTQSIVQEQHKQEVCRFQTGQDHQEWDKVLELFTVFHQKWILETPTRCCFVFFDRKQHLVVLWVLIVGMRFLWLGNSWPGHYPWSQPEIRATIQGLLARIVPFWGLGSVSCFCWGYFWWVFLRGRGHESGQIIATSHDRFPPKWWCSKRNPLIS